MSATGATGPTGLDALLVEVLACPEDKGPLWWVADEAVLYNPRRRRAYRVEDGIPVLLVEEGRDVSDEDHERYVALAESGAVVETGRPGGGAK